MKDFIGQDLHVGDLVAGVPPHWRTGVMLSRMRIISIGAIHVKAIDEGEYLAYTRSGHSNWIRHIARPGTSFIKLSEK